MIVRTPRYMGDSSLDTSLIAVANSMIDVSDPNAVVPGTGLTVGELKAAGYSQNDIIALYQTAITQAGAGSPGSAVGASVGNFLKSNIPGTSLPNYYAVGALLALALLLGGKA